MADPPGVRHTHLIDFPEALDAFYSRLGELRVVLGPGAAAGLEQGEALLREALAARERGDAPGAVRRIGEAMARFANVASEALPAEGPPLRAIAEQFRRALAAGALGSARDTAEGMRERSGSVVIPKKVQ
jgi:hypothetical protein